jgi:hypothetical protein
MPILTVTLNVTDCPEARALLEQLEALQPTGEDLASYFCDDCQED